MSLPFKIKSLNDVAESLRSLYKEVEGGFVLDVDGVESKEDVEKLQATLQKERQAAKDLKSKVDELSKKIQKPGDTDPSAQLQAALKELEEQKNKLTETKGRLHSKVLESEISAAIGETKGNQKILAKLIKDNLKVVEDESGQMKVVVVDENGNPRIKDAKGSVMQPVELLQEWKKDPDLAHAFYAQEKSGTGAPSHHSGAGTNSAKELKTEKDKVSFIAEHGFDAFTKLSKE